MSITNDGLGVEDLVAMSQQDFRAMVDRDVRGVLSKHHAALLRVDDPEVNERWYQALVFIKKNVESSFASRREESRLERMELISKAELLERGSVSGEHGRVTYKTPTPEEIQQARDLRARADEMHRTYLKWRTGALRFRGFAEERLSEATWRRAVTDKTMLMERNAELARTVEDLREQHRKCMAVIRAHREAMAELDDDDIDSTDRDLWDLLDDVRETPPT